jgi:two-component system cell cycle sensor histidine kinase/response regulator CckA
LPQKDQNTFPGWMKVAFFASVLTLLATGVWFFRSQQELQQRSVETTLWSIANLKVAQIAEWRAEKLADAAVLTSRSALTDSVRKYLSDPTDFERAEILRRLRPIMDRHNFVNVLVVDPQRRIRLGLNPNVGLCPENTAVIDKAFAERRPVWASLHLSPKEAFPHISLVVPLFSEKEGQSPVGAIVLVLDAAHFLYPLIQFWPVPSETAETLLARKDGDDVLFLNELRHQKGTALKFRIPLSHVDLPAAMAIKGVKGIVEGKDYRGVDVVAAILPVPASPWFMVSKVDTKEAFAEWRFRSILIAAFILGGLALVAAVAFIVRQRNLKAHYRALYRSEANLNKALKRHRITLNAIGDAVISTDAKGRVDLMNPVAEALTGWPQAEAHGRKLQEVFPIVNEHTRAPVEDPVAKVLMEGTVVGLANHTLLVARDGNEIPIADSGSPIRDEEGNTIGVVLVFKDQSSERQYQKKILESERKYRLLMDNTLDVIWTMNMDLEFTYVNPTIQALTGHKPEEWVGTRLSEHSEEEAFSHMAKIISGEAAKGEDPQGFVLETEMLRKDNSIIPVEIHGKVIFDEQGHPVGLQGTTRDITERRKAEEVEKRLERQFHQAQKLESVGRLAGGIAHDLNNLLSPIIGYGEMLLANEFDVSLREEAAEEILNAGNGPGIWCARSWRSAADRLWHLRRSI